MNDTPGQTADDEAPTPRLFLLRVFLCVVLFAASDLWLARHTGYGLDARIMGGFGAFAVLALSWAETIVNTTDENLWKTLVRNVVGFLLHWRTLAVLYAIAGFLMLNLSSVMVLKDHGDLATTVSIEAVDGLGQVQDWVCDHGDGPWRFCVWSNPFGSSYRVTAEGFLPRVVEVYPLVGATLQLGEDLQRSPTVLIRPPFKALDTLSRCDDATSTQQPKKCGQFTLCQMDKDGGCADILTAEGHANSVLVGWPQAVPRGLLQDWLLELRAQQVDVNTPISAQAIIEWRDFKAFVPGTEVAAGRRVPPLLPGTTLRAEVRSQEHNLVACKVFIVESVPFMDIAMTSTVAGDPPATAEGCPQ